MSELSRRLGRPVPCQGVLEAYLNQGTQTVRDMLRLPPRPPDAHAGSALRAEIGGPFGGRRAAPGRMADPGQAGPAFPPGRAGLRSCRAGEAAPAAHRRDPLDGYEVRPDPPRPSPWRPAARPRRHGGDPWDDPWRGGASPAPVRRSAGAQAGGLPPPRRGPDAGSGVGRAGRGARRPSRRWPFCASSCGRNDFHGAPEGCRRRLTPRRSLRPTGGGVMSRALQLSQSEHDR